jgi:hypothetical protein
MKRNLITALMGHLCNVHVLTAAAPCCHTTARHTNRPRLAGEPLGASVPDG